MAEVIHVVLLRPKVGMAVGAVERLDGALRALVGVVSGLTEYRWGTNVSPEGKGQGYELGFVMRFVDAGARDAYLPHPEHVAVGPLVRAVADEVLVFDFEA